MDSLKTCVLLLIFILYISSVSATIRELSVYSLKPDTGKMVRECHLFGTQSCIWSSLRPDKQQLQDLGTPLVNSAYIGNVLTNYEKTVVNNIPYFCTKCEWEGKNGTCVNYWNCVTNVIDKAHGIQPPTCENEGTDNEVYTCCTSCHVLANISSNNIFEDLGFWQLGTGKKSKDKCIDYLNDYKYPCYNNLISRRLKKEYLEEEKCFDFSMVPRDAAVDRVDAKKEEFPHMAQLGYGEDQESAVWMCGGTIISDRFILTAAHCRSSLELGEVRFVGLGILKRSDPPSLWQVYHVDTFIPHPEYKLPSKYHDIALIRTDREISLGGPVLPACLAQGDEQSTDKGVATGWDVLGHGEAPADLLQKVDVTEFSSEQCSEMYKPRRNLKEGYNHTIQMCYGESEPGTEICAGVSGGPLQLVNECPHVVFGVISAGLACGHAGAATLYTRVTFYLPWIESIVWP